MDYTIVALPERHIIGPTTRTDNNDPACSEKIGTLWQSFMEGGMGESVPEAVLEPYACYGLYYNFDFTNMGYDVMVGCESTANAAPEGMEQLVIPAGNYAKFVVEGDVVQAVIKAWDKIWAMEDLLAKRANTVDFEAYLPGENPEKAVIELYISLK